MADKEKMLDLKTEGDPAEFLLSSPKYHDCHLTVGIPDTGDVERIGVSSTQLIAHSSVFRDMLADSPLADPSGDNTHIKDVSTTTFKLMLRHVYGGKLPKLTPDEAAELALCADKYNIQRLVGKAAKRLKPSTAEDIFPALLCVAYINCSELELQVSKIIQGQAEKICQNKTFLQLDENCLLFIVKQSTLNITELQLWDNIVRWGENQMETRPDKTLRDCLNKVLQHVRLRTLTLNEIVDHVLPKKVLTSDEFMDLTLAVSKKQTLQSPGLCKIQEKRGVFILETEKKDSSNKDKKKEMGTFFLSLPPPHSIFEETWSKVLIKTAVNVEINTMTLKGNKTKSEVNYQWHTIGGTHMHSDTVTVNGTARYIVLQVKKNDNKPLVLEANQSYILKIHTSPALPVYKMNEQRYGPVSTSKVTMSSRRNPNYRNITTSLRCSHFTIIFDFDHSHVIEIDYKA